MPPEMIQPGRSDVRGYVDSSRPGSTALDALSDALGETSKVIGYYADKKTKENTEAAYDLLSSPLLTDEEINEIEREYNNPLVRIRAQNARGGLLVQERWEEIQDEVAKAPDAVEARRILRERQQEILEQVDDPAVQAGIRQRFADQAPDLLTGAAKRRVVAQEEEERLIVSQDLQAAINAGPQAFSQVWGGHAYDASVAGKDMDEYHTLAAQTLKNHWMSGDDGLRNNPDTPEVLEAIDSALNSGNIVDPKHRAPYIALRENIEADEEARLGDPEVARKNAAKAAFLAQYKSVSAWKAKNPGVPIDPDVIEELRAAAVTKADVDSVDSLAKAALDDPKIPGVLGTKEHTEARALLKASLGTIDEIAEPADLLAMELYDGAVRQLPPSLKQDPVELRRILGDLGKQAKDRAQRTIDKQIEEEDKFNAEIESLEADYQSATTPEEKRAAVSQIQQRTRERSAQTVRSYRNSVNLLLRSQGFDPNYLDTLPE